MVLSNLEYGERGELLERMKEGKEEETRAGGAGSVS